MKLSAVTKKEQKVPRVNVLTLAICDLSFVALNRIDHFRWNSSKAIFSASLYPTELKGTKRQKWAC